VLFLRTNQLLGHMKALLTFFSGTLFSIGGQAITVGSFLLFLVLSVGTFLLLRLNYTRILPRLFEKYPFSAKSRKKIRLKLLYLSLAFYVWVSLSILKMDQVIYESDFITIKLTNIFAALLVLIAAQILDAILTRIRQSSRLETQLNSLVKDDRREAPAGHTTQWLVYTIVALFLINTFSMDQSLFVLKGYSVRLDGIFIFIAVMLSARIISWTLTKILLPTYFKSKGMEQGAIYASSQLLGYLVYVVGFFVALNLIDVKMNWLLGGTAALLVGVGLGLQQTFNDFFSGILLLSERTIHVGDVVDVKGAVGIVRKIGLRTSFIETRENITVIVPNSRLITDHVINWTHSHNKARFEIKVHVAFNSDAELVKKILLATVKDQATVSKDPEPFVRFMSWGEYALEFHVLFWSDELMNIEDVKSDIRFELNNKFAEYGVQIPYPQHQIQMSNSAKSFITMT
jgi:small-conductance mechanosensitive channel